MNSFYSPIFLSKVLKSYLFDINRLGNLNDEKLRRYQDKHLRKMVKFAYTVPLYHDKYKKAGIHPEDINGIKDIKKLPMVSKYDFKKYYPDGIISSKINKNKLIEVSTSGTTGKSLSMYVDMFDIVVGLFGYIEIPISSVSFIPDNFLASFIAAYNPPILSISFDKPIKLS